MDMSKYREVNGTYYTTRDDRLIAVLENIMKARCRVRLFYGDTETGRDWLEQFDSMGRISRSSGPCKIPILLKRRGSRGGPAILDNAIVKITVDRVVIYQHPKYHTGLLTVEESDIFRDRYAILRDGEVIAVGTQPDCEALRDFFLGVKNRW